ncbi:hypothetical protein [Nitrosomonas sp.]|uniref:REP-associated tyrosine transposase n=1 Tax=Nitrosomonas sp. TaxID=42353 RepID=UPI00272F4AB1|nr:hypothetical protein [Nitrosomonas sp.]MDP2224742.1 hypothetical protein [Nitrosomonas sp.]
MPNYRRNRQPGGTYFFTVNLLDRKSQWLVTHIDELRTAVRKTRQMYPFHIDAWVVLPEHLHCIWTLPEGDTNYSNRWRLIKQGRTDKHSAIRHNPRRHLHTIHHHLHFRPLSRIIAVYFLTNWIRTQNCVVNEIDYLDGWRCAYPSYPLIDTLLHIHWITT